jgi:predicted DNA-binding transcriptional regulator AlpA
MENMLMKGTMATVAEAQAGDRLLRVGEVAGRLGISVRAVWKNVASRRLPPPVRLGRAVRWRESEIARFIALGCVWPPPGEHELAETERGRRAASAGARK